MQSVFASGLHRTLPFNLPHTLAGHAAPDGIQTAIRNACYVCEKKSFRKVLTHTLDI